MGGEFLVSVAVDESVGCGALGVAISDAVPVSSTSEIDPFSVVGGETGDESAAGGDPWVSTTADVRGQLTNNPGREPERKGRPMAAKKLDANEEAKKLFKSAPNRNICMKCGYEFDEETRPYDGECPACGQHSLPIASGGRVSEPEKHDRSYNGGEFGKGEW